MIVDLEIQVHTNDDREGTRIHIAIEAVGNLRIQAVVLCNCKHVVRCCIDTSAQCLEEIRETVAERDVVALQEGQFRSNRLLLQLKI